MIENGENLAELPKGWFWTTLKDVCLQPQYGWTTSAVQQGRLRLLRTTDITSGKINWECVPFCEKEPDDKSKYLLEDGDIVISRAGSVGFSLLIRNPKESIFASYLIRFKPLIDKDYAAYFLKTPAYWGAISEKKLGIALANVNATKLKEIAIPLAPQNEQKRIVAKIEELFTRLDAGVDALKKIKAQLKRYRQAVLKHAFTGKLTEKWRQAHKGKLEPASKLLERIAKEREKTAKGKAKKLPPLDTSELPELPDGWEWANLEPLSESMKNGIYKPRNFYSEGGIACLRMYNIEAGTIVWKNIKRMNLNSEEIKEYGLEPGDLLVNRVNSRELVGKTAVILDGLEPCVYESKNIRLRLRKKDVNPKFVSFWFLLFAQRYFNRNAQQVVGMASISQPQIASMPVPLMCAKEQNHIVDEIERHFSIADEVEQAIEKSLKEADRLRQSILKKAFEGKLVEQNPEDEPAEKLLERIKAAKAKLQKEQKAKRKKVR